MLVKGIYQLFLIIDGYGFKKFTIFANEFRLNVGVCLISTHFFGCPLPTFYQFVLGWVSSFNLTKSLNDMKTLGSFLERWAFGGLGGLCSKMNAW